MRKARNTEPAAGAAEVKEAAATRIHLVADRDSNDKWLVDATSRTQARARVTADRFVVTIPSAKEVIDLMRADVPVLTGEATA